MTFGGDIDSGPPPPAWFLADSPLPLRWHQASAFRWSNGRTSGTAPVEIANHWQRNWGVRVDAGGQSLHKNEHHRNVAIAITADVALGAVDVVIARDLDAAPSNGPDASRFAALLRPVLQAAEGAYRPPAEMPASSRGLSQETPIHIEALQRVTIDGSSLWRVDAVRKIPSEYDRPVVRSDRRAQRVGCRRGGTAEDLRSGVLSDGLRSQRRRADRVDRCGALR